MSTILHLNTSIRSSGSHSRTLSGEFLAMLAVPGKDTVIERDLAGQPVPHLDEATMGAFFTPADKRSPAQNQALALSDKLIAEVQSADTIVIGAPMYNFSISSGFKAWIDHVARAGVTFKYTETGPVGLLQGKKVFVFTARGGVYSYGPAAAMDFHETYLRAVLGFIGLTDVTFVHTEGLGMGEEAVKQAVAQTRGKVAELAAA
ncbi:FMN-dependent NADH-azoreductase [Oxalobacteraceae bacterium CAVE-383]|nr:FMN-dependent NADH-azoreductase [Oxalobacteraceae bacterium CAVE-383]